MEVISMKKNMSFWEWFFRSMDVAHLYQILKISKITINGFRINSPRSIKEENISLIARTLSTNRNIGKVTKILESAKGPTDQEDTLDFDLEELVLKVNQENLFPIVANLIRHKRLDFAMSLYNQVEDHVKAQSVGESSGKSELVEKKILVEQMLKLKKELLRLKKDYKTAENKTKSDLKEIQKKYRGELEKFSQVLTDHAKELTVLVRIRKELTEKLVISEKEKEDLIAENVALSTALEELKNSHEIMKNAQEKVEVENSSNKEKIKIILVGNPPWINRLINDKKFHFILVEDQQVESFEFENKGSAVWVIQSELKTKVFLKLKENQSFKNLGSRVSYFTDFQSLVKEKQNIIEKWG